MTKLEIPEGDFNAPWEIYDVAEKSCVEIQDSDKNLICQLPMNGLDDIATLLHKAPAMAEEIAKLRAEKIKLERFSNYYQKQLGICQELLSGSGVPEWVTLQKDPSVPANSVPSRLEWYLLRRKSISEDEAKQ